MCGGIVKISTPRAHVQPQRNGGEMLSKDDFMEACFLKHNLIHRRGHVGKVDVLLDLLRRASPEQRQILAASMNPELRLKAVETAVRFTEALLGLVGDVPAPAASK